MGIVSVKTKLKNKLGLNGVVMHQWLQQLPEHPPIGYVHLQNMFSPTFRILLTRLFWCQYGWRPLVSIMLLNKEGTSQPHISIASQIPKKLHQPFPSSLPLAPILPPPLIENVGGNLGDDDGTSS